MGEPATAGGLPATSRAAHSVPPTVANAAPLAARRAPLAPTVLVPVGMTMLAPVGIVKSTVPPIARLAVVSRPVFSVTLVAPFWLITIDEAPGLTAKPTFVLFLNRWLLVAPEAPLISSVPPPSVSCDEP